MTAPAATKLLGSQARRDAPAVKRGPASLTIAVILPALNEELTIGETIHGFHAALPDAAIIVVDNGSIDQTRVRALEALGTSGASGEVLSEPRRGKGFAMRWAFHMVVADVYLMADADMTYPPEQASQLIAPIVAGAADMVIGSRLAGGTFAKQNRRRFHHLGNRLILWLVNRLFDAALSDIMSGYRAMSRSFVSHYPIMVRGFELETDMTIHALDRRYRVRELAVDYRSRPDGSHSKLRTFADGRRVVGTIISVVRYYRPLLFFGTMGIVAALVGFIAAAPVLADWIDFRYIYHVPSAVLATGLEIVALVCVGIGLILDSVVRLARMTFELDAFKREE